MLEEKKEHSRNGPPCLQWFVPVGINSFSFFCSLRRSNNCLAFFWPGSHFRTLKTHREEFVWSIFKGSTRVPQKGINLKFRLVGFASWEPSNILKHLPACKSKDYGGPPWKPWALKSICSKKLKREIILFKIKNVSVMGVFLNNQIKSNLYCQCTGCVQWNWIKIQWVIFRVYGKVNQLIVDLFNV